MDSYLHKKLKTQSIMINEMKVMMSCWQCKVKQYIKLIIELDFKNLKIKTKI